MNSVDFEIDRFYDASERDFKRALSEVAAGAKLSHWMWYIFPQLRGLGYSPTANYYGIVDWDEAMMFLQHPQLGRICMQ